MTVEVWPWQRSAWDALAARRRSGQFPHALMITGAIGVGKQHFSDCLTAALLCTQPNPEGYACGRCRSCLLRANDSHPDSLRLSIPEDKTTIGIGQIRDLRDFLALTRQLAPHKVITIAPAEAMTTEAANSLLKSLEEPVSGVVLVLLSAWPTRVPATVRSRCQRIELRLPERAQALEWLAPQIDPSLDPVLLLELANGAPAAALQWGQADALARRRALFDAWAGVAEGDRDPLSVAAEWLKRDELGGLLGWIEGWLADIARLRATGRAADGRNQDLAETLQRWANRLDLLQIDHCYRQASEARRLSQTQANDQLVLENVLVDWARCGRAARQA